ncbi:cytochrome P450 [Methylomicrobium sp. Wu6]|uniref:cytochrome P450 n=1 Tax=Methylomicrobium sp. Wu6 TaxID=3107928 RepID=UPI002DD61D5C|nr:cytochrome P450 [Methylomicrobium sp. Wu6]MEC4747424.1 cytochrome P450 [Methylomicrobium sp. Wu6]
MQPNRRPAPYSQLPGPKGLPLLGNLLQIDLHKLHLILEEWADIYGGIYQFRLANKPVVAISDTELIQQILRDRPRTYRRISAIERITKELGTHGVFAAEGEQWQRHRTLTMQAFRPDNLRRFFPTLHGITERLHNRWCAAAGQAIDLRQDWMRFTVDVTTQFAFGYDINLLESESAEFQQHLECQLPVFNRWANSPFPYWHFVKLPSDRAMEKSLVAIKETINGFVRQTRQRLAEQPATGLQPANFLETLLLARDDDGAGLSDEEIQGNIITVLLAGEDTTAHTLSWLLHLIGEHPEVQKQMQQEADSVLGSETLPPDIGTLEKLPYIEAVAQETLRLKNVAPMLYLEPVMDVELNGFTIPQGVTLMLLNRHGALQEQNFNDARAFIPERWLAAHPACPHNRSAFIPFGAGPRFCPGRNLAMLEIKMAIAMVCRNFTVTGVETGQPVREVFSFTMMPENLKIRFDRR